MRMSPISWAVPVVSLGAIVMLSGVAPATARELPTAPRHSYGPVSYPGTLESVSAVSASDVWAVGFHDDAHEVSSTLAEHWNGHFWSLVTTPTFGGGGGASLVGVSAVSASDVWAVGNSYNGTEFDTLVEHWDGVSWTQVPSPSPGGLTGSYLFGVSARSATDVWAVGRTYDGPLIEHWDGSTWTQVASPGDVGTELDGVSAVTADDAFAVGQTFGAFSRPFILRWDGTSWTKMAIDRSDKRGHGLSVAGVSATSSDDAWAVGTATTYRHVINRSLIEHWDGAHWQRVAGLDPGGRFGTTLAGVSGLSAGDVWAVGSYGVDRSGRSRTFIEHWNGTRWKLTHSANPGGAGESEVAAVDALDPSHAWVAGSYVRGTEKTMTQNWDGSRWLQL